MQSESKPVNLKAAAASLGTNHSIIGLFGFLLQLCLFFGLFFVLSLYEATSYEMQTESNTAELFVVLFVLYVLSLFI